MEDAPSLPVLLSHVPGQWDVVTQGIAAVVLTVTNGHLGITGGF